jgi:UDP-GlcNAc3NAcA epimerase
MKILTIVGARPQFVKAAVVSRAISNFNTLELSHSRTSQLQEILVHTGQHFDANMSQVFFDEMDIPQPGYNLGIGGGSHGQNTGRMIEKIEEVLLKEKPDRVLVYGDTDSTLAGALAAAKLHIPVAHIEAGLRSFNRRMPEEINRVLTDHVADLLFAPTETAVQNLANEGISGEKVVRSGDVMYDAALYYQKSARKPDIEGLPDSDFVLCTLHRAENTDDPERLKDIMDAIETISAKIPVILPLHPRTRARLFGLPTTDSPINRLTDSLTTDSPIHSRILTAPPVGYLEMVWLLEHCRMVMTDSGGLQKEAYFFQTPCVTLRDETEWVELVEAGANTLAGADKAAIINAFAQAKTTVITDEQLYGDGKSAQHIVDAILSNAD